MQNLVVDNIQTRAFAGAFLRWQDEVILMKRSEHKKIAPGMWAGIGGHIEPGEENSPITACLREIEEETGIVSSQIEELSFRYFALCRQPSAIHSIYYFTGILKEKPILRKTSEGDLHWVKLEDAINFQMSAFMKSFYLHWINNLSDTSLHCFLDSDIHLLK